METDTALQATFMGSAVERQEQFERMLREHGQALARFASAYERNVSSRDDLVQDIALALWRALPKFRGDCSERTLVFRIAYNRALTHIERRRGGAVAIDELPEVADPAATPETLTAAGQLRNRLLQAVRELPIGNRQVILLLLEGMSHAEISEVLGITEGNVAVRATRARKELRELLGDVQ